MSKADEKKIDIFLHKCIRRILKIRWPMKISNEELRQKTRMQQAQQGSEAKKMEMDRACIADGTVQTPEDCTDLEASRKAKTRKAKRDMEEDDREGKTTA